MATLVHRRSTCQANPPTVIAFGFGDGAKMSVLDEIVQTNTGKADMKAKKVNEYVMFCSFAEQ